jgi:hypothetical protein
MGLTEKNFSDISGHWAEVTINKWKEKGVISGYPDGTFKPDNFVTRAELAKIITDAFNLQDKSVLTYEDLNGTEWYFQYAEYADKYLPLYPLITLYPNNIPYTNNNDSPYVYKNFLPDVKVMRMHVAESLVKLMMEMKNLTIELPDITDMADSLIEFYADGSEFSIIGDPHGQIPDNLRRMIENGWLAMELGIICGNDTGSFRPYGLITRAELLTILDRLF